MKTSKVSILFLVPAPLILFSFDKNIVTESRLEDGVTIVKQSKGVTLGYSESSEIRLIYKDGLMFKDLKKIMNWIHMRIGEE
ncbi:hypothetical protein [Cecembia sp.]|uniref:hypothetical protein n=1 Tax=Cecembia sp. TaxID=1898110 RepID=UPI0025C10CAE|nr:hypothetical protein [Cecembia sp.]